MEEGLNGEGKSVRDSPVPAKRKTADDDDDDEDEKDSEMTLNTYSRLTSGVGNVSRLAAGRASKRYASLL